MDEDASHDLIIQSLTPEESARTSAEDDVIDIVEFVDNLNTVFVNEGPQVAEEKLKRHMSWAVPFCYKLKKNVSPLDKTQPQDGASAKAHLFLFPVLNGFLDYNSELTTFVKVSRASDI